MVVSRCLGVELADTHADSVVERCGTTGAVVLVCEFVRGACRHIVEDVTLVRAVEGDERHALLHVLMKSLHLLHGLYCLVESHKGLLLDDTHAAALVDNNQIKYSFHSFSPYYFCF